MPTRAQRIHATLSLHFAPERLEVMDESDQHAGHGGARPEGETHYAVRMVSAAFTGMNRVARQRAVNHALAELLEERVHALAIKARAPGE